MKSYHWLRQPFFRGGGAAATEGLSRGHLRGSVESPPPPSMVTVEFRCCLRLLEFRSHANTRETLEVECRIRISVVK